MTNAAELAWDAMVTAGIDQLHHPLRDAFASAEANADDTHDERDGAWYETFVLGFQAALDYDEDSRHQFAVLAITLP